MTNQQSKAWSAALLRAARLIQEHYGVAFNLQEENSAEITSDITETVRDAKRRGNDRDNRFLAQLEAAE